MKEKPAEKVRGFFLYSPFTHRHFFRVYGEVDPATGRKTFTDYRVCAEDIEVTLEAGGLSLYEKESDEPFGGAGDEKGGNRLDWSSRVLGRDGKDHLDVRTPKKGGDVQS